MRKVTTYQLIDGIKRNLALLIVPAILLFGLVFGLGMKKVGGTYQASAVLIATADEGEEISYNKLILNEKLANIYSEIIKSPDLYKKVENDLKKGGSSLSYKEIMDHSDFEVNPQAGLINLTYNDSNKDRAADALKSTCENFRLMAKDYMNADNLAYLHEVLVDKAPKKKLIIFSVAAAIAGAILGLAMVIIKTLLSDNIADEDDLRDLDYDVLGSSDELSKVKAKIDHRLQNGVLGITSLGKTDSYDFAKALAESLAPANGVLFIDSKNKADLEGKYLSEVGSFKVLRKGAIDYLAIPEKASDKIIDTNEFFAEIANRENTYNYIIIDQKSLKTADPYLGARLCDMEIILVDSKSKKAALDKAISDLRELGIDYCGVVYHK
ncbi:hypothetical protein [uncultured Anaerococcus sp.]|uniref:hypothetical protein n=1 Tax=uncultured Anaerococcus sp. TaxID=293428 RepID=UPI0028060173|nr:hypothetical protein [uncultured Anaerococcus sp.]